MLNEFKSSRKTAMCGALSALIAVSISLNAQPASAARGGFLHNTQRNEDQIVIRDKWALLIGVDKFQDPSVAPNKEAANNIETLAKILYSPAAGRFSPGHVRTLTGSHATASGINSAINDWLVKKALPDDLIFLYVSSVINKGQEGQPIAFSFDTLGSESELSGIDLRDFLTEVRKRTQCRFIVCALDASAAPRTRGADLHKLSETGVTVLSATDGTEKSLNNGVTGSSVFIHHLGEALSLEGGQLTLDQVFDHLSKYISDDAERAFHTRQTPTLILGEDATITQVALGAQPRVVPGASMNIGHPLSRLALEHPGLIAPHDLGDQGAILVAKNSGDGHPGTKSGGAAAGNVKAGKSGEASIKADGATTGKPGGTEVKSGEAAGKSAEPGAKPAGESVNRGHRPAHDLDEDDDEDEAKWAARRQQVDYGPYMSKMKQDIQKHWTPPKGLESRKVMTVFTIMRDGRILDAHILEGSGIDTVDQSALDALKAASPLDPLPPGSPASVDIKYKFDWQVRQQKSAP